METAEGEAGPPGALSGPHFSRAPSLTRPASCGPSSLGWSVFFFHTRTHQDVQPMVNKELFLPPRCFLLSVPALRQGTHLGGLTAQAGPARCLQLRHHAPPQSRPGSGGLQDEEGAIPVLQVLAGRLGWARGCQSQAQRLITISACASPSHALCGAAAPLAPHICSCLEEALRTEAAPQPLPKGRSVFGGGLPECQG